LKGFEESCVRKRCTIISNGWIYGRFHAILNFLVAFPQGTMFLKSMDASSHRKDAQLLFDILDEVVMEVGVENVLWVIIDNESTYVYVGKKLEGKHKTLLWTMCIVRCLYLMLEDIGKLEWVKKAIDHYR
jgi:hypothetical protein